MSTTPPTTPPPGQPIREIDPADLRSDDSLTLGRILDISSIDKGQVSRAIGTIIGRVRFREQAAVQLLKLAAGTIAVTMVTTVIVGITVGTGLAVTTVVAGSTLAYQIAWMAVAVLSDEAAGPAVPGTTGAGGGVLQRIVDAVRRPDSS